MIVRIYRLKWSIVHENSQQKVFSWSTFPEADEKNSFSGPLSKKLTRKTLFLIRFHRS